MTLTQLFTNIADAIRAKTGSSETIIAEDFPTEIAGIQSGKLTNAEYNEADEDVDSILNDINVVNFYDYDGSLLYSYTKSDFLELSALPANPTHTGLTAQGWNWTLADAKTYVTAYGGLDIGQMYTTTSGNTEFDIELNESTGLTIKLTVSGTKDWGDGTTDNLNTHTYSTKGKYTISMSGITSLASTIFDQSSSTVNYFLKDVRFGSIIYLSNYAFQYCNSLRSVTMSNTITYIGNYTFQHCYSLESIVIPNTVETIGNYGLSICFSLRKIIMSNSVTLIGNSAFNNCYSLKNIFLPTSVTNFGASLFQYCYELENVVITNAFSSITNNMFTACYSLKNIKLPDTITSIGSYAFQYCYALERIIVPNSVTTIGNNAFHYCYSLESVVLSNTLATIGEVIFQNCYSLESVEIPDTVTSMGVGMLRDCFALKEVKISSAITTIPVNFMANCICIKELIIPNTVTSIGNGSFSSLNTVEKIDFSDFSTIPTLDTNAFANMNKTAKIVVPDSLYEDWIAANNWSTYANNIVKASEVV